MDFKWVVPILIILVSSGPNCSEQTKGVSYQDHPNDCEPETFRDSKNQNSGCQTCNKCSPLQVEIEKCTSNRNRKCACQDGYYYDHDNSICQRCSTLKDWDKLGISTECCKGDFCKKDPQCRKRCSNSTAPPKTTSASAKSTIDTSTILRETSSVPTATTFAGTKPSNSSPAQDPFIMQPWHIGVWLPLMVAVLSTLLVLCWLLLLFFGKKCPYWIASKDLEIPPQDPYFNEQSSHQGSDPATLTFNIHEETPLMTVCQKPPAHNSNHPPDSKGEQSDRWPAIVLYAIIKEVPLRRWKEFLRLLSVAEQQMERVELEAGLGSIEKQYQMLRLWSQRSSASLNDVYSSLHYMDLSGCVQLLQESLEKLQWRSGAEQGFTP